MEIQRSWENEGDNMENKKWRGTAGNPRFETKSAKWRWEPEVVAVSVAIPKSRATPGDWVWMVTNSVSIPSQ